jgi:hypothetical protein
MQKVEEGRDNGVKQADMKGSRANFFSVRIIICYFKA